MSIFRHALRQVLPDWLLLPAKTHHDLLEQHLARIGLTMTAYGALKGLAETGIVALCIYGVAEGAPPTLAILVAGAVVLGWETVEKWMLLNDVDQEALEQLQSDDPGED